MRRSVRLSRPTHVVLLLVVLAALHFIPRSPSGRTGSGFRDAIEHNDVMSMRVNVWFNPELINNMGGKYAAKPEFPYDETPLIYAIDVNQLRAASYLISKGANLEVKSLDGMTALQITSEKGQTEIASILLKKGANPNQGDLPPLHLAAYNGHLKIVKLLIAYHANINAVAPLNRYSLTGEYAAVTPLDCAIIGGQAEVANYLAAAGGRRYIH
jgi:hypothetical protein